jgi:hypothetical protein
MSARRNNEGDSLGDQKEMAALGGQYLKWGTCGWAKDQQQSDVAELGDGTTGPLGRTLVHVTLFEGRDITTDPMPGKADGRPVKCQIGWPLTVVPLLGMQVVVAFPDGDIDSPGNGIILTAAAPASTTQFAADRAILDVGPTVTLTIKAMALTLTDHVADTPGQFGAWIGIGPIGNGGASTIYATDGAGGVLTISENAAGLAVGDGSGGVGAGFQLGGPSSNAPGVGCFYNGGGMGSAMMTLDDAGNWNFGGQTFVAGTGTVTLGANATPMNTVLWGPTGEAGVASLTVFTQP